MTRNPSDEKRVVLLSQRAFTLILITVAVDGIGAGIINSAFPLLVMELSGRSVQSAAIYCGSMWVLFSVVQFFAAPILGKLSDDFGRKPIILGSLTAFGITWLIFAAAPSMSWLFIGVILLGAFSATLSAVNACVADITPAEDRTRRFGVILSASGAGLVLGPLLSGALEKYGLRVTFYAAASLVLCNVLCSFFLLPETLHTKKRRSFSIERAGPQSAFAQVRDNPQVLRLLCAFGLVEVSVMTVGLMWSFFTIAKFGWSQREIGFSLSVYAIATVLVQGVLVGCINRRLGNMRTVSFGALCMIVGLLGYAFADEGWIMFAFAAPTALGAMGCPALISQMSIQIPDDSQGGLQGMIASTNSVSMMLTPILMTPLFSYFSGTNALIYFPGAPFLTAALIAICGLLIAHSTKPHVQLRERPAARASTRNT